jgi:hypothetical protein
MKSKLSRFEVNKEVRHVMARHSVDTSLMSFQTYGHEVAITGILWHTDNSDFNAHQLEALIQDFQQTLPDYSLRGDTENWSFTSSSMRRAHGLRDQENEDGTTTSAPVESFEIKVGEAGDSGDDSGDF